MSAPTSLSGVVQGAQGARGNRREVVSKILEAIGQAGRFGNRGVVNGREKHLFSHLQKMQENT